MATPPTQVDDSGTDPDDQQTTDTMSQNDTTDSDDVPANVTEVITPTATDTNDSDYDSPVERMKRDLPDKLHRSFVAASEDHALIKTAGSKDGLISDTPVEVQQMLSNGIYEDPDVFFREWLQNHVAAITREAERRIRNEYGEDGLFTTVLHDHPSFDGVHQIRLPKKASDIIDAARDIGYTPRIEFIVNHDEGKLITRDNGISMTAGEVIDIWKEPAQSGSGVDLSSAGNKGIGSLTWVNIAGETGAATITCRTRREQTPSGEVVPQFDRDGFQFYSYFGGVVPLPDDVDDGFYGTKFELNIQDSVDPRGFESAMSDYTDILPTMVSWVEIRDGVRDEEEFEQSTFLSRYDREPAIVIDRPGEFTLVLDEPGIVPKGSSHNDTYLLDNPIEWQSGRYSSRSLNTLWNDHVQVHNEQGLIIAGPNRGKRRANVDELAGNRGDISDPDKPMPDVPLPEPVASRDTFKNDEALGRFEDYLNEVAKDAELARISEFTNGFLNADTPADAAKFMRESDSDWSLFHKLVQKHAGSTSYNSATALGRWLDARDEIEWDKTEAPYMCASPNDTPSLDHTAHPKRANLELLYRLKKQVSVAEEEAYGSIDKKDHRSDEVLGELLGAKQQWPVFVGYKLNDDRAEVVWHEDNYPDAAILKVSGYSDWTGDPINARKLKDVPFSHNEAEDCDEDWTVPEHINSSHSNTGSNLVKNDDGETIDLSDPDNFQERPVDIRHTENAAIDFTATVGDLMDGIGRYDRKKADPADTDSPKFRVEEAGTGYGRTVEQRHIVLFSLHRGDKISDHYDWSEHATLIKVNKMEFEALHRLEHVYTPDELTEKLKSPTFSVYDPHKQVGYTQSLHSLIEDDARVRWVSEDADLLNAAIRGKDISYKGYEFPTDHPAYDRARNLVLGEMNVYLDKQDRQYKIATWTGEESPDTVDGYFNFVATDEDITVAYDKTCDSPFPSRSVRMSLDNISSYRESGFTETFEKFMHPAWDRDSPAWTRLNATGFRRDKGQKEWEKEMALACRDLGIDPAEDPHVRRTLNHLVDRCSEDD